MSEPVQIGLVAHYAFCPRRAWLEAAGEKTDTRQVAVGLQAHSSSDDPSRSRPATVRALDVASEEWGVVGRCDTVHVKPDGTVDLVEHKATPVRREPRVTKPMRVQLALQRHALREGGFDVRSTGVWFSSHGVAVGVELSELDDVEARNMVHATRQVVDSPVAPPPLEDDARCSSCSHISVCLPDERAMTAVKREIRVTDPDAQVVHLTTFGCRASVRRGRLLVHRLGEQLATLPLERVWAVVVHGNIDLTGGLIRELLYRDVPILWCSSAGRLVGWAASANSPNGGPRARQAVASEVGRLDLAREFVSSKIAGQATLLRRHGGAPDAVARLRVLSRAATVAGGIPALLGHEGEAAAEYFRHFGEMLKPEVVAWQGIEFRGRVRRPATDPVNAALNYAYASSSPTWCAPFWPAAWTHTTVSCTQAGETSRPLLSTWLRNFVQQLPSPRCSVLSTTGSSRGRTSRRRSAPPRYATAGGRCSWRPMSDASPGASDIQRSVMS